MKCIDPNRVFHAQMITTGQTITITTKNIMMAAAEVLDRFIAFSPVLVLGLTTVLLPQAFSLVSEEVAGAVELSGSKPLRSAH
jgi:hypothetical protein